MDIDANILTSSATASSFTALHGSSSSSSSSSSRPIDSLNDLTEVQVKFFTRQPDLPQVPETFLNVPVKLARYGLSEIVNALTETGQQSTEMEKHTIIISPANSSLCHCIIVSFLTDPPRPFDFLIRGQFLRSDLLRYLRSTNQSGEGGLELEYVEAEPEPESKPSRPHPDWIASVDAKGGRGQYVVTGCYDSVVRVFDANESKSAAIALGTGHASAIKSVAVFRPLSNDVKQEGKSSGSLQIVSGSKDRTVRVWSFTPGQQHLKCIAECATHTESVEAVATVKGSDIVRCITNANVGDRRGVVGTCVVFGTFLIISISVFFLFVCFYSLLAV